MGTSTKKTRATWNLADPVQFVLAMADINDVGSIGVVDGLYCHQCGSLQRVNVVALYVGVLRKVKRPTSALWSHAGSPPSAYQLSCVNCETVSVGVLYEGPEGEAVAILTSVDGGISTPNTPAPVAYYLDEAAKCEAANAFSAATAMYRAALEQFLYEQGFQSGMLDAKIKALVATLGTGQAKEWTRTVKSDFLDIIKGLGNGAIHPNGGDISIQSHFDADLLNDLRETMTELLVHAYERPAEEANRLARLSTKRQLVDVKPAKATKSGKS